MELENIRQRLDSINWQLLTLLNERLMLVKEVATQKGRNGDGIIHAPGREAAIFDRTIDQCRVLNLDPNYVLEIISLIIAHAKDAECDVLGLDTPLDKRPKEQHVLRSNLLELTRATASHYVPEYCEGSGADAVRSYLARERNHLIASIDALDRRTLALDLGCANGTATEILETHFEQVRGFDVCGKMIESAQGRRQWQNHVKFVAADIKDVIPAGDASVSFAIANFGAASEVSHALLPELSRVLQPGGKAFLSFYNKDAMSTFWYYPWPSTMRAHLNPYNDTVEVWFGDKVYVVHAIAMTVARLQAECEQQGLRIEWVETYPTTLSIIPRFFFSSGRFQSVVEAATEIDESLARSQTQRGTYITALITK